MPPKKGKFIFSVREWKLLKELCMAFDFSSCISFIRFIYFFFFLLSLNWSNRRYRKSRKMHLNLSKSRAT